MDPAFVSAMQEALATADTDKLSRGIKDLPPAVVAEAVAALRAQANGAFKRGAFGEAIELYTQAIAGAPADHTLFSNRCLARLKAAEGKAKAKAAGKENDGKEGNGRAALLAAALGDAERAIELEPGWVKGYYRKACVLFALERWADAGPYLRKVVAAAPDDAEAQRMLGVVEAKGLLMGSKSAGAVTGAGAAASRAEEERDLKQDDGDDDARSVATAATAATGRGSGGDDWTSVALPRKVYYPTQEWYGRNQIAPGLVKLLKDYGDMDGPRRLVEALQDKALTDHWLAALAHERAQWWGADEPNRRRPKRCLLIGALGGVAPLQLLPPTDASGDDETAKTTKTTVLLVAERSSWVARAVQGVVQKNRQLRRQTQAAAAEGTGPGEGERESEAAAEAARVVVLRSPPSSLTALDLAGLQSPPPSIPTPEGLKPDPSLLLDRVLFLDWDHSLLGTGAAKIYRDLHRRGFLAPGATLSPSHYSLYAMGIEIFPQATNKANGSGSDSDSDDAIPLPPSLPTLVWEAGPSKFDLPEGAYRPLTAPSPVWEAQAFLDSTPKVKELAMEVTQAGTLHAVVYWFTCHDDQDQSDGRPAAFDSRAFPSVGRGVCYLDPTPVAAPSSPSAPSSVCRVRAYRSESQVGFWPLKEEKEGTDTAAVPVPVVQRGYRLPKWYPSMLLDETRNAAYRQAIARVCKGKRVLEAGSGTGLLAAMLERAGAAKVLGCEEVPALAAASREILSAKTKVFEKDVRQLQLEVPPEVIVHELFDAGLLGEGVLHLLAPTRQTAKRLLPARAKVYGQVMEARFEAQLAGVNLTLLNPYRFQKDYHSSPFDPAQGDGRFARALSAPFLIDTVDFATDPPGRKAIQLPDIAATAGGVASAVRLWHVVDFGDGEESKEEGSTVLDSRETHWGYAVMYINEARVEAGERVPLMATRLDTEYAFKLAQNALPPGRLLPTPRCDMAWMAAEQALEAKAGDILTRIATTRTEEAAAIVRTAYRIAAHPAEFGVEPAMAAKFFHSVLRVKRHAAAGHGR